MREAGNLIAVLEQSPGEPQSSPHISSHLARLQLYSHPSPLLSVQISYFTFNPLRQTRMTGQKSQFAGSFN